MMEIENELRALHNHGVCSDPIFGIHKSQVPNLWQHLCARIPLNKPLSVVNEISCPVKEADIYNKPVMESNQDVLEYLHIGLNEINFEPVFQSKNTRFKQAHRDHMYKLQTTMQAGVFNMSTMTYLLNNSGRNGDPSRSRLVYLIFGRKVPTLKFVYGDEGEELFLVYKSGLRSNKSQNLFTMTRAVRRGGEGVGGWKVPVLHLLCTDSNSEPNSPAVPQEIREKTPLNRENRVMKVKVQLQPTLSKIDPYTDLVLLQQQQNLLFDQHGEHSSSMLPLLVPDTHSYQEFEPTVPSQQISKLRCLFNETNGDAFDKFVAVCLEEGAKI